MRRWISIVVAIFAVAVSVSAALSIAAPPPTDHVEQGKANGSASSSWRTARALSGRT